MKTINFSYSFWEAIKHNRIFFLLTVAVGMIVGVLLLIHTKTELHIAVNQCHTETMDDFFKYLTWLGDGWVTTLVVIVLLFIQFRLSLTLFAASMLGSLVVHVIKNIFNAQRPSHYFYHWVPNYQLYFVPGVKIYGYGSFPSGHTVSAFVLFLLLSLWLARNRPFLQALFFLVALLIGFSRIYLNQHFLVDVWAGMLLGVATTLPVWIAIQHWQNHWLDQRLKWIVHE